MATLGYITIEGVDAVGKTTLVEGLREHYRRLGISIATKPEFPTAPNVAATINQALERSLFIGEGFPGGAAPAFFFMFYAEMTAIAELPSSADMVIGDRGLDSICLYQGAAVRGREGFRAEEIVGAMELAYSSLGLRLPERTLLLTLPTTVLPLRFKSRNGRRPSQSELDQLVWLQEQFMAVAARRSRFVVVDAQVGSEILLSEAIRAIEE